MENQAYYRDGLDSAGQCELAVPVRVNCVGYVSLSRAFRTDGKRHDYYLQLMDAGELFCGTEGAEERFLPGEFILYPPETAYRYGLAEDRRMGYYWAHFTGNYAETLLRNNGLETGRIYRMEEEIPASVRRAFSEMFREFMMHGRGYEDICTAKLTEILVELARLVSPYGVARERRLAGVMEYIHRHYTEDLSIAELAASEHMSVSRFREVFRQTFGCAPSEYIMGLRMQNARDLLTGTNLTVTRIAELCGYGDELYFMRLFRKKTGMSARAYRLGTAGRGKGERE